MSDYIDEGYQELEVAKEDDHERSVGTLVNNSKQLNYERVGLTPLLQLNPDSWKNIPHPVIDSIKLLINLCQRHFNKSLEQEVM